MPEAHLVLDQLLGRQLCSPLYHQTQQSVRKTPHTSHKGGSREVSHVQSLISRLASREEKMAQQLFLAGLALSSIWEKGRARDRQREVAGDKGQ
jgi:hypothetical protein